MTITAYPLCWPAGWRRIPASSRAHGHFSKGERQYSSSGSGSWMRRRDLTVNDAVQRVLAELQRLGVLNGDAIISTNVPVRLDGLPRSNLAEPADPGVAVYWRRPLDNGMQCMAVDRYLRVADNLAAIAATLEALRAIERHGGAAILDRAFTGFAALPSTVEAQHWRDVLEFAADARLTRADIDERYKRLRSREHPDKGGTAEGFQAVQRAYEQACAEVAA